MKIKRCFSQSKKHHSENLVIYGAVHFDDEEAFCGYPWMLLSANRDVDSSHANQYQIKICIHDQDDFDIGYIYTADSEKQFFNVLHELINWMNDLEHGVAYYYEDLIEDLNGKKEFFPNYMGCKREPW